MEWRLQELSRRALAPAWLLRWLVSKSFGDSLRRASLSVPVCEGGFRFMYPNSPLFLYFTTNIEVGAELVLVVETSVRTPLEGVIL